jgi:hypothetical protein
MKLFFVVFMIVITSTAFSQVEISSGFAVNKNNAAGFPVLIGYEFKIKERTYTKSELGYKYLHIYNDHVGASLNVSSFEIHQTVSYEIVKKRKFILNPNIGLNYKFYHWKGEMRPPYNTLPQRAWLIGVHNGYFVLNSYDDGYSKEYSVHNLGFSFQLQTQYYISDKVWLHVTPFMEPDCNGSQNTGGVYIGVIFKSL